MFLLLACGIQGGAEKGDQAEPPIWDGDGETDTDTTGGPDTEPAAACPTAEAPTCSIALLSATIGDGGVASVLDTVTVTLDGDDPDAWVSIDGVPGVSWIEGSTLTFTPTEPLAASSGYTARACWCGGEYSFDFGTLDTDPVLAPDELAGRTWMVPLTDGVVVSPPFLGQTFAAMAGDLLVQAIEADEDDLQLRLAWRDDAEKELVQSPYDETLDVEGSFEQNPAFRAVEQDWDLYWVSFEAAEAVRFDASFDPAGATLRDGTLSMRVDVSEWHTAFGEADSDAFCALLTTWGDSCVSCADGNPYCLQFTWEQLAGEEVDLDLFARRNP